jgi:hypothetical protein
VKKAKPTSKPICPAIRFQIENNIFPLNVAIICSIADQIEVSYEKHRK